MRSRLPLLIVTLITALAYDLSRPKSEPTVPWAVLMAHQLGFAAARVSLGRQRPLSDPTPGITG